MRPKCVDLLVTAMDGTISSSSSSTIFCSLDFQCPFLRPGCPESLLRTSILFTRLASTVLEVRTWRTVTQGAPLSKPVVDIVTAQPITDADASVVVFMSVQVLQVSRLSARNFPSFYQNTGWSTVYHAEDLPCLAVCAVVWVVPQDRPNAGEDISCGAIWRFRRPTA
ncbi:hypothetical protein Tco_1319534 [Tanacetum coccineum]